MSDVVTLIHQKHDYSHVKKKKAGTKWQGAEGDKNMEYIGRREHLFNISHTDHILTTNGIKKGRRKRRPIAILRDEYIALYPQYEKIWKGVFNFFLHIRNMFKH